VGLAYGSVELDELIVGWFPGRLRD
jgi:hypothetical protein